MFIFTVLFLSYFALGSSSIWMCRISNICCCFLQASPDEKIKTSIQNSQFEIRNSQFEILYPPVDLHLFFETSIRAEKKFQLELKKNQLVYTDFFFQFLLNFFFSSNLELKKNSVRTEKKY